MGERRSGADRARREARERAAARPRTGPREAELIVRWGAGGWRGQTLRAADGAAYTVVFEGRPGGSVGPDFRDAVLLAEDGARLTGDIELHLAPSGWRAHGHATDPRYNNVALHVALVAGGPADAEGTPLASGRRAPLVALSAQPDAAGLVNGFHPPPWPCAPLASESASVRAARLTALARSAGSTRLRERAAALAVARARVRPAGLWDPASRALFIAIAEALGYGRDRDALRRCGERLAAGEPPDALLTEHDRLGALERRRVAGLLALQTRWLAEGPLVALRAALARGGERAGARGALHALVEELTSPGKGIVSVGRARIIAINAVLPALLLDAHDHSDHAEHQTWDALAALVEAFPGLPSNQITREMALRLGLERAPGGALAQQGLHHLWERHCREKRCDGCPCAIKR